LALFSQTEFEQLKYPLFGSEEHAKVSYDVAKESMTLLKNKNNILPLKSNDKIFVCGPSANSLNLLNGAWTHTWQGVDASYNTKNKFTILEALQNQNGLNVSYELGVSIDSIQNIEDCLREAKKADKIIICVGETPSTEIVGNINDLTLSSPQIELINQLAILEKPIILVCNFNRPRILSVIESKVDAILYSYLPGDEGGKAIKDVLVGIENPSGKLPFTYPRFVNSFVHYDHKATEDLDVDFSMNAYKPQFDFGFGMSYTTFEYSNLIVSDTNLYDKQKITVSVTVKNSGKVKGKEVVQLYYNDLVASITPSVKKLTKFSKIELKPNETRKIEFEIKKSDFSFINKDLKRVTEPGEIELIINNLKKIIYVQ
jgi:beta-glucosidase